MTPRNINGVPLPKRYSHDWQQAADAAYRHPSGILCVKGSLGEDYPGYQDFQHAKDCAVLYWQIISNSLSSGRYLKHPDILRNNYQSYLDACQHGQIEPLHRPEVLVAYYEPERAAFHEDTGKAFLPMTCYYDQEHDWKNLRDMLPEELRPVFAKLYTYARAERLKFMRATESIYKEWENCKLLKESA